MPIEIRELHIKIIVDESVGTDHKTTAPVIDHDAIVSDCVDQVLEILNNKKER